MAIMGDIIEIHHRRQHPRLGALDDTQSVAAISELLSNCEQSLEKLSRDVETGEYASMTSSGPSIKDLISGISMQSSAAAAPPVPPTPSRGLKDQSRMQLVTAYSTHILHVLHVLLHGKWDAISMLDDDDDWITSARFNSCASHAIAASQAVSQILKFDPELTFMPYLFGIYLLHGSFILLLFADRMPQLGQNQSVEQACETIIRAHEVCVVTLSTEFQVILSPPQQYPEVLVLGWKGKGKLTLWFCRKTSERCFDLPCIAFVARARRNGKSIGRGGEPFHYTGGLKAQRAWDFEICFGRLEALF